MTTLAICTNHKLFISVCSELEIYWRTINYCKYSNKLISNSNLLSLHVIISISPLWVKSSTTPNFTCLCIDYIWLLHSRNNKSSKNQSIKYNKRCDVYKFMWIMIQSSSKLMYYCTFNLFFLSCSSYFLYIYYKPFWMVSISFLSMVNPPVGKRLRSIWCSWKISYPGGNWGTEVGFYYKWLRSLFYSSCPNFFRYSCLFWSSITLLNTSVAFRPKSSLFIAAVLITADDLSFCSCLARDGFVSSPTFFRIFFWIGGSSFISYIYLLMSIFLLFSILSSTEVVSIKSTCLIKHVRAESEFFFASVEGS